MIKPTLLLLLLGIIYMSANAQPSPKQIAWTTAGKLPDTGGAGVFTGVHKNVLLIGGGANFPNKMPWEGGIKVFQRQLFAFKNEKGQLQPIAIKTQLSTPIAYGMSISTTAGVVCVGGENEEGGIKTAFLLEWEALRQEVLTKPLPSLPLPLSNALIAEKNGKIYVAGGESEGQSMSTFLCLDLNQLEKGWQHLPNVPMAVSHSAGGIQSNGEGDSFFLLGGRRKNPDGISTFYSDCFAFDLKKNIWKKLNPITVNGDVMGISAATSVAVGTTYLLMVSGDNGQTFRQVERFNKEIAETKSETQKQILREQKAKLLNNHPGFLKEVLLYNTISNQWQTLGKIPSAGQVTTTAIKWGNEIYIPSGEIRAGVRTPDIWKGTIQ